MKTYRESPWPPKARLLLICLTGCFFQFFLVDPSWATMPLEEKANCDQFDIPGNEAGQTKLNKCYEEEYNRIDKDLNSKYRILLSRKKADNSDLLKKAESAWIKYRDQQCDYETSPMIGGSIFPMARFMCLEDKTKSRIAEIEYQLNCEAGDIQCNGRQD